MTLATQKLYSAVTSASADEVLRLLEQGADPNTCTDNELYPVQAAAALSQPDILRHLLAHGGNPDLEDPSAISPLLMAATGGRVENLRILLEHGADPHDGTSRSALHSAAGNGHAECVDLLLAHGAELFDDQEEVESPQVLAARGQHRHILHRLLQHAVQRKDSPSAAWNRLAHAAICGQDEDLAACIRDGLNVDEMDPFCFTPLTLATCAGDAEACARLLRHGADVAAAEHYATVCAVRYGQLDCLRLLLQHGGSLDAVDMERNTLLHEAAANGQAEAALFLLRQGAPINALNANGETPLILAAQHGHAEVLRALMQHGAETEHVVHDCETALSLAVRRITDLSTIRLMLQRGARVDAFPLRSLSSIVVRNALSNSNPEIAAFILKHALARTSLRINPNDLLRSTHLHGANIPCLLSLGGRCSVLTERLPAAVKSNRLQFAAALLSNGADGTWCDSSTEETLLHLWVEHKGSVQLGKLLLVAGASPNARTVDGLTPLHLAARAGDCLRAEILLDAGADPNAMEAYGSSVLSFALPFNTDTGDYLLSRGADINAMPPDGWSPLHSAVACQYMDEAHWLLSHGANPTLRCNCCQRTPLEIAQRAGNDKLIQLLKEFLPA